jgi:predicted phage terminase large subunit-like protein
MQHQGETYSITSSARASKQEPVADGGNLIKWDWFRFYDTPPTPQSGDRIIVSWDTAMSGKELASYSACVVLLVRGETAYVLDVVRERLEYPALKRKIIDLHRRWRYAGTNYALLIENKGSGMSLIQDLSQEKFHAVPVDPEGDKVIRMNQQTARIEAGSVSLPRRASWLDEFRRELMAFPAGRYTDQVDAFSQALKRAFTDRGHKMRVGFIDYGGRIHWRDPN